MKRHTHVFNLFRVLLLVLVVGTCGYVVIEGWSWFDAFYMTVITLATVGYGETHPLSLTGRMFTIVLILGGMGLILYIVSELTQFFIEGGVGGILRRRRMEKLLTKISHHYILCGAGKYGKYVLEELLRTKRSVVVIERDHAKIAELLAQGVPAIEGDAASDDVLKTAGIERARGLVTSLPDDKENLFVVITARGLNPSLRIVSKVNDFGTREKFLRSGADAAVSATFIGGLRMASELIRPETTNFLDTMLRDNSNLRVDQVRVPSSSRYCGKTIQQCTPFEKEGVLLVAVQRKNEEQYVFNPPRSFPIAAEDVFIVLGSAEQLSALRTAIEKE